jgi:hypothetical protein
VHEDHIFAIRFRTRRARARLVALGAAALVSLALVPAVTTPAGAQIRPTATTVAKPPVFAYYYLWWSANHWKSALGPNYPIAANPLPLPATLDSTGCGAKTRYIGNTLTDVTSRIYSQDDAGFIEADVRQAAAAGLTGFLVNWIGTGSAHPVRYQQSLQQAAAGTGERGAQGERRRHSVQALAQLQGLGHRAVGPLHHQ